MEALDYQMQDALENDGFDDDDLSIASWNDNAVVASIHNSPPEDEDESNPEPPTLQENVIASHDYLLHFREDEEENHLVHDIAADNPSRDASVSKECKACIIPLRVAASSCIYCRASFPSLISAFLTSPQIPASYCFSSSSSDCAPCRKSPNSSPA